MKGLAAAYIRGETDEFVQPTAIYKSDKKPLKIESDDVVIFMNFRSDRAKQLSLALIDPTFSKFNRTNYPKLADFISLTSYGADIPSRIAFPPVLPKKGLGACLAQAGLRQLRIAETEKYAHVTFF